MTAGLRFASRLGFVEQMRMWESRLDVNGCDLMPFRSAVARAATSGVRITTLAEELPHDPTALPRIYALNTDIGADIPQPDRFTPPDFQMSVDHFVESPRAIQEAFFLAVVDDDYAGFSNLQKPKQGDWLHQGTTGVRRAYRGRGIATALKVRTVEYAKALGVREIRTWNEIRNTGILAINDRFGFVRQPAWITFVKEL
jgi:RimJ/RimL family protein N-acetyltransferase